MIDTAPPPILVPIVEDAKTHEPTFFFGFMGVGDEKAMKSLESAAALRRFPSSRTTNDKDQVEVMVLFPVGSDQREAIALYHDAVGGRFGRLVLEVTIAPLSAAADGSIDMEKEVTIEPVEKILVPRR